MEHGVPGDTDRCRCLVAGDRLGLADDLEVELAPTGSARAADARDLLGELLAPSGTPFYRKRSLDVTNPRL